MTPRGMQSGSADVSKTGACEARYSLPDPKRFNGSCTHIYHIFLNGNAATSVLSAQHHLVKLTYYTLICHSAHAHAHTHLVISSPSKSTTGFATTIFAKEGMLPKYRGAASRLRIGSGSCAPGLAGFCARLCHIAPKLVALVQLGRTGEG